MADSESTPALPPSSSDDQSSNSTFPEPSPLLKVVSVIVIGGCLFVLSLLTGANIADRSGMILCGSLLFFFLFAHLGHQQFLGTFRYSLLGAATAKCFLYAFGGVVLFFVVLTTLASLRDFQIKLLGFLFLMTLTGVSFIAAGRLNGRWSRELTVASDAGLQPPTRRGYSIRDLLLLTTVVAIVVGIAAYVAKSGKPPTVEHVTAAESGLNLPTGAHNVSYGRGVRGSIAYEFSCDEQAFKNWVAGGIGSWEAISSGVTLQEIESPVCIEIYKSFAQPVQPVHSVIVTNGLSYDWSEEDRGVRGVYDRDAGRGYYFHQSN